MNYDDLYNAWMEEKDDVKLKPLSVDFYKQAHLYLKSLIEEKSGLDEESVKRKLLEKEAANVKKMIEDLMKMRNKKVLISTLRGNTTDVNLFTNEEAQTYSNLTAINDSFKKLLKSTVEDYVTQSKTKRNIKHKKILVRFLQAIPAIVGINMKTYGPFKAEDLASLPIENAEILIKKGLAVEVDAK
jgi:DNA replication factor GINS